MLDGTGTEYEFVGDDSDRYSINAGFNIACVLPNGWMPFFDSFVLLENDAFDRHRAVLQLRGL